MLTPKVMSTPASPSRASNTDFDARAATWDDDPLKVERALAVARSIEREVPLVTTMRALEYGAGTGLLSFLLRPHLGDITLADASDGMLAVARAKIAAAGDPHMRAIKLDLIADPAPQQRFDIVYSLMTLHHIPDTRAILCRFREVLVASGTLCIADLDREDGSFHGPGFKGHNGFDRDALGTLALESGFGDVRFVTAYEMHKSGAGSERVYPLFLMSVKAQ